MYYGELHLYLHACVICVRSAVCRMRDRVFPARLGTREVASWPVGLLASWPLGLLGTEITKGRNTFTPRSPNQQNRRSDFREV